MSVDTAGTPRFGASDGSRRTPRGIVGGLALVVLLWAVIAGRALAAAGALDPSFSQDGKRVVSFDNGSGFDRAESVAIRGDGRIVAAGTSQQTGTGFDFALARFRTDGTLDGSLSGDGKRLTPFTPANTTDAARGVAVTGGKIVVAGSSNQGAAPATGEDFAVARYLPNGSLDGSFSGNGKRVVSFGNGSGSDLGYDVAIQANGRIVVAGSSNQPGTGSNFALARFRANGSPDSSFSGDGKLVTSFGSGAGLDVAHSVTIQRDGRIVAAGYSNQGATGTDFAVARYLPNGSLDSSFSGDGRRVASFSNSSGFDRIEDVAIQTDGRIVVAGRSDQGGTTGQDFALARFLPNGSLDSTFSGDGKRVTSFANTLDPDTGDGAEGVAIQSGGRIVVAGFSYQPDNTIDFAVARYLANGDLDGSFSGDGKRVASFGASPADFGHALALQRNGRIVVAGSSIQSGTGSDFGVARFLAG